ncbi:uncharacterized protein CANTADRAFT_31921, partial [Suhomyces tanzawaensis NRRL Y-17324]
SRPSRKPGFLKRVSSEWNLLVHRIKSISKDVFTTDELVEELFVDLDSDEASMERILKSSNRALNPAEESFLQEYKKFKNLDKMVQHHQNHQSAEVRSSSTAVSDTKTRSTLLDIIRQTTSNSETVHSEDEDHDNEISYHDLDLCKLRQELELHQNSESTEASTLKSSNENLGTTLWEYRRRKWLQNSDPEKVQQKLSQLSIEHIPKESYHKIYSFLIDKGRSLKNDKKINLLDLINIINAGWIAEEKWDRAARGLP